MFTIMKTFQTLLYFYPLSPYLVNTYGQILIVSRSMHITSGGGSNKSKYRESKPVMDNNNNL